MFIMGTRRIFFSRVVIVIFIVLGLITMCTSAVDLYYIAYNKAEYQLIYSFTENDSHWQFQSSTKFVIWNLGWMTYSFLMVFCAIKSWTKYKASFVIISALTLFLILRYFSLWHLSGYDHYPGFDPYIF